MEASDRTVAAEFEIPELAFSTRLGFTSQSTYRLAEQFLFGRVSGARLPPTRYSRLTADMEPDLWIDIEPLGAAKATVAFRGAVESPRYEAELDGFHWDFSKVINGLVMESAVGTDLIPIHGACIRTPHGLALLPGASGAGKSSIACAALSVGHPVHASELSFVQQGRFQCGNSALTIDRGALELFGLSPAPDARDTYSADGTRLIIDLANQGQDHVRRLIFPQVHPGDVAVRSITSRRARMLLFENVVTQLPLVQLLAQETWPIWRPPGREVAERIMTEVDRLSKLNPVIVSGHPLHIAQAIGSGEI